VATISSLEIQHVIVFVNCAKNQVASGAKYNKIIVILFTEIVVLSFKARFSELKQSNITED